MEYKEVLEEETYYMVKHLGFTDFDVQNMPVWRRKYQLGLYMREMEKQEQEIEKAKKKSKR